MDAEEPRSLADRDLRSEDPGVCPFLRSVSRGAFRAPVEKASTTNRCVAGGPAEPQPLDWQRAACLAASHARCPRYMLGADGPAISQVVDDRRRPSDRKAAPVTAAVATEAVAPVASNDAELVRGSRLLTPAIAISLTLLVLSTAAAISFVAVAGGLRLPTSPPAGAARGSWTPAIVSSPEPSAASTVAPTAAPTPQATAAPVPPPSPSPSPTPAPSSDRYLVLTPCPSKPDCYLYTVKVGDSLQRIARYFGVPYDTVLAMNPGITDPSTIHPGDVLELPPPTR